MAGDTIKAASELVSASYKANELSITGGFAQYVRKTANNVYEINIPAGTTCSLPLWITYSPDFDTEIDSHLVFNLGTSSELIFIEDFRSSSSHSSSFTTTFKAEDGVKLQHYTLITSDCKKNTIFNTASNTSVKSVTVIAGGKTVSNYTKADLQASDTNLELYGLILGKGTQQTINQVEVTHHAPNCTSYTLYKGIYNDSANNKFDGIIEVDAGAQKTDAIQSIKSLLLSNEAVSTASPQLKIYADDVKCSHGTTVGQLDDEALFYLESRGINKNDARQLLIEAFSADITKRISLPLFLEEVEKIQSL